MLLHLLVWCCWFIRRRGGTTKGVITVDWLLPGNSRVHELARTRAGERIYALTGLKMFSLTRASLNGLFPR